MHKQNTTRLKNKIHTETRKLNSCGKCLIANLYENFTSTNDLCTCSLISIWICYGQWSNCKIRGRGTL